MIEKNILFLLFDDQKLPLKGKQYLTKKKKEEKIDFYHNYLFAFPYGV